VITRQQAGLNTRVATCLPGLDLIGLALTHALRLLIWSIIAEWVVRGRSSCHHSFIHIPVLSRPSQPIQHLRPGRFVRKRDSATKSVEFLPRCLASDSRIDRLIIRQCPGLQVVPAKQETGAVLIALGLGCCPLLHTKQNWRMQAYGPFSLPKLISVGPGWTGPLPTFANFLFSFLMSFS